MKPGIKNSGRGVLFFLAGVFLWGMTMGSDQVSAVEAMKRGAYDFVPKPFTVQLRFSSIAPHSPFINNVLTEAVSSMRR